MKPTPRSSHVARTVLICTLALAAPLFLSSSAFAQKGGGGAHSSGGSGGHASGGSGGHSSGSSGAHASGASHPTGGHASGGTTSTPSGSTGGAVPRGSAPASTPSGTGRTHDGHDVEGKAVPRGTARPTGATGVGGGYAGFYPLGGVVYGGYYGGYYDPWYGGGDPYYVPPAPHEAQGAIKLKITPKQAMVYVDGYFAGIVDDFDGLFQKLHVEPGRHRIEVTAEGYEPLSFDVDIAADETITYHGDLRRIQ